MIHRVFGYEPGNVSPRTAEAAELRWAYKQILAGSTLSGISRAWNSRGVLTSQGRTWRPTTVRQMLLAPRYAGLRVHHGSALLGPDGNYVKGQWKSIVSVETWEATHAKLTDPARRKQRGTIRTALLSNVAICGRCGAKMIGGSNSKFRFYRCKADTHNTRRMDYVDYVVEEVLLRRLELPDARQQLLPVDTAQSEVRKLRDELSSVRASLVALEEKFADDLLSKAVYLRKRTEKQEREVELVQQIESSDASRIHVLADAVGPGIRQRWKDYDAARRGAIVDSLMTVTILPVYKGARFSEQSIAIEWK